MLEILHNKAGTVYFLIRYRKHYSKARPTSPVLHFICYMDYEYGVGWLRPPSYTATCSDAFVPYL